MALTFKKTVTAAAVSLMMITPVAAGITLLTADAAVANPGKGNGAGKGGANAKARGQERAAANRGGQRGAIASELGALNAAHANQTALEHASPDSMPGKLYVYQQTGGMTVDEIVALNDARALKQDLDAMTDADKLALYDADGDGVLSEEEAQAFTEALAEVEALEAEHADAYAALAALKDGSLSLSEGALNELNAMLGL